MKTLLPAIALTAAAALTFVAPSAHAGSHFNFKSFGHQGGNFSHTQQQGPSGKFNNNHKKDQSKKVVDFKNDKKSDKKNDKFGKNDKNSKKQKFSKHNKNHKNQWNNWNPKGGNFCLPPVKDDCGIGGKKGSKGGNKGGDCKAVPTPSAAAAGVIGLAGLAARRRRRSEVLAD